jgi:hypothetical protein
VSAWSRSLAIEKADNTYIEAATLYQQASVKRARWNIKLTLARMLLDRDLSNRRIKCGAQSSWT